jgi:NADH dehydrogenase (ubiquinone) Fe-S protein 4
MRDRLFTPVPKRVMNGSEDGDVLPAAVLSGAPIELQARQVRYETQRNQDIP